MSMLMFRNIEGKVLRISNFFCFNNNQNLCFHCFFWPIWQTFNFYFQWKGVNISNLHVLLYKSNHINSFITLRAKHRYEKVKFLNHHPIWWFSKNRAVMLKISRCEGVHPSLWNFLWCISILIDRMKTKRQTN